jgi:hypothetical protein
MGIAGAPKAAESAAIMGMGAAIGMAISGDAIATPLLPSSIIPS